MPVITFKPNGSIEFTRSSEPLITDLEQHGRKSVKRMTEILFSEEDQKYYIVWTAGPFSYRNILSVVGYTLDPEGNLEPENIKLFETYEQAVEYEIAMVDYLRLHGLVFDDGSHLDTELYLAYIEFLRDVTIVDR